MTPIWGVGRLGAVSTDDVARDIGSAAKALRSLGLARGSRALVLSRMSEGPQYFPFLAALLAIGAQLSLAEATRFDAYRTSLFLRRVRYDAALGVDADVLEGLADLGAEPAGAFAGVPVVAARAGAYERLRAAGMRPRLWLHLGPTIAVECDRAAGAHVDADEWEVETRGGEVVVTALRSRAVSSRSLRTGLFGSVTTEPCGCGRPGPRILPGGGTR